MWMKPGLGVYVALTQESSSEPESLRWDSPAASLQGLLCSNPPDTIKWLMMCVSSATADAYKQPWTERTKARRTIKTLTIVWIWRTFKLYY